MTGTTSYEGLMVNAIGEFGKSQIIIWLVIKGSTVIVAWGMVMTALIGADVEWWKEVTAFNTTSNTTYVKRMFKVCPTSANETVVFDQSIKTIVNDWNLICSRSWIPTTITTTQMIGVLTGAAVIGQFGDWFGRKKTLLSAYIIVLLSILIQGFSVNWQMMACCSFVLGFGLGAFLVCSNIFYLEFVSTKWRTATAALPSWQVGTMLLGLGFKLFPNWRHLCYANVVLGLPILILFWFCPESIRWLLAHGRVTEAKKTLADLAYRNGKPTPDFDLIDEVARRDYAEEKMEKLKYNYYTLLRNKTTRWKTLVFGYIWFTMGFGFYAITFGVSRLDGDVSLNMFLQGLMEALSNIVLVIVSKYAGRKWCSFILIIFTALSLFGMTTTYFVADSATFSKTQNVLSLVAKFFVSAGWFSIILFTIETFPTVIRNTAYGLSNVFARVGGILAPQNKVLNDISPHLPYTVNGVFQVISAIFCLLLVDTYNACLEDHFEEEEGRSSGETRVLPAAEELQIHA